MLININSSTTVRRNLPHMEAINLIRASPRIIKDKEMPKSRFLPLQQGFKLRHPSKQEAGQVLELIARTNRTISSSKGSPFGLPLGTKEIRDRTRNGVSNTRNARIAFRYGLVPIKLESNKIRVAILSLNPKINKIIKKSISAIHYINPRKDLKKPFRILRIKK